MHYLDEGRGPVVVAVHGNPTWCYYFRNLVVGLSEKYRVVVPDHIGCGLSQRVSQRFTLRDRIAHLTQLLDLLGVRKFSLVLHDWGGPIGTGVAVQRPESIISLTYLNTLLGRLDSLPLLLRLAAKSRWGRFGLEKTNLFLDITLNSGTSQSLSPEIKRCYRAPYLAASKRGAIGDFVRDIPLDPSHITHSTLITIQEGTRALQDIPVRVLWGEKDPCFKGPHLEHLKSLFPQADVTIFPNASHLILEDLPGECCRLIEKFLSDRARVIPTSDDKVTDSTTKHDIPEFTTQEETDFLTSDIKGDGSSSGGVASIVDTFQAHAEANPTKEAVIHCRGGRNGIEADIVSYGELHERVLKYATALSDLGLAAGQRVLLLVPFGADAIALAMAVIGCRAQPVFVDPGIGRQRLKICLNDAACDAIIGLPKAFALLPLVSDVVRRAKLRVVFTKRWALGLANLATLLKYPARPLFRLNELNESDGVAEHDIALVAFTSGATGVPKGVEFTHQMLLRSLGLFRDTLGLDEDAREMSLLPIFSLFDIGLGATTVIPPFDPSRPIALEPEVIFDVARRYSVTHSFGSPTLWSKLASHALAHSTTLPALEKLFIIGAPVSERTLELLGSAFGFGKILIPYGATECLPAALISAVERQGVEQQSADERPRSQCGWLGLPIGRAVAGLAIKIVECRDETIARLVDVRECVPLEIGEIIVSGSQVSSAYVNRPDANAAGKIREEDRVWHRMGDLGYMDHDGRLFFCGRKMHRVEASSGSYYSVPAELVFNRHPWVARSALVADPRTKEPCLVVEPIGGAYPELEIERTRFRQELSQCAESDLSVANIKRFFVHPAFPVDPRHNAKIFREQLATWILRSGKPL